MNRESLFLSLSVVAAVCSTAPAQQEVRWTRLTDLNTPQQYHACVAVEGRVYTVGGYRDAAFEEYDVKSNVWRVLP